jgi:murein DD-endopeptidase MepM/ murein hydrolase activator NlpD
MFNIDLQEIVNINHISDASSIEVNQLLFIPKIPRTQPEVQQFAAEDFIWPLKGKLISSFGQTFRNMLNKGINIQPYSDLSILAARSGKVIFSSGNFKEFGKTIIIDHGDGLSSVYARLAEVFVKAGDEVAKGTVIAKADSAGSGNKFVYLHFQIRKGHIAQNPLFYLPR